MNKQPDFDLQATHKYYSAHCFNRAWDYIDLPKRTPDEENTMLQLSLASLWHWTQREDSTFTNLSIGYWQVARVFALLRQADNARTYGKLCLEAAQEEGVQPYYSGAAYEALARAEFVAGDQTAMQEYLDQAHQIVETLTDHEEKEMLLKDLATIA
jgi:hypothetical protein